MKTSDSEIQRSILELSKTNPDLAKQLQILRDSLKNDRFDCKCISQKTTNGNSTLGTSGVSSS